MAETKAPVVMSYLQSGIAVVRMQRKDNRINLEFIRAFNECLDEIENNTDCKGVIITGEAKFFSNGLDLEGFTRLDQDSLRRFYKDMHILLSRLLTFPLPTMAAINGHCFAGGAVIASACDVRVMNSERGWLCFNEVFIERRFSNFMLKMLQAKMDATTYHKALAFGQRFTGPEAQSAGMVDKSVPAALVLKESERYLASWIGKKGYPRESLQNMKKDIYADALKAFEPSNL